MSRAAPGDAEEGSSQRSGNNVLSKAEVRELDAVLLGAYGHDAACVGPQEVAPRLAQQDDGFQAESASFQWDVTSSK